MNPKENDNEIIELTDEELDDFRPIAAQKQAALNRS